MSLYPIFLKLHGHKVLIVGGGCIAEGKVEGVLRSATDVTVLAPKLTPRLQLWAEQGLVKHAAEEYRPGLARGYFLVLAATDSAQVNRAVYCEARADGALCNAVDDPGHCDFYAPAVVNRGDFQIAVSTGGNSPALAQRVRKSLEQQFGPEYGAWTTWLGQVRKTLRAALPQSQWRKELLHLLAACSPQLVSNIRRSSGGKDGPGKTCSAGSQVEGNVERASA